MEKKYLSSEALLAVVQDADSLQLELAAPSVVKMINVLENQSVTDPEIASPRDKPKTSSLADLELVIERPMATAIMDSVSQIADKSTFFLI